MPRQILCDRMKTARGGHPTHQIQALDRTQPGLPTKPGKAGTMTHDYKRHGTTTLFAALTVLEGSVISRCMQRHRHQEFLRFLDAIDGTISASRFSGGIGGFRLISSVE